MIALTVAILANSLVGRPVKNGDARLKHTATEKTAAVPVAEAESTKVLPRSALRHREDHSRAPPGTGVWAWLLLILILIPIINSFNMGGHPPVVADRLAVVWLSSQI